MRDYDENSTSRKADLSKYSNGYTENASAGMVLLWNVSLLSKAFGTCSCFKGT